MTLESTRNESCEKQADAEGNANQESRLTCLAIEQPHCPGCARGHGNSEKALESVHPPARPRQPAAECRDIGDEQERKAQSQSERGEYCGRSDRWKQERRAESCAKERSRAGGRNESCQRAGPEATCRLS